ncbi:unnamed protein product [Haemonchus placei]|uniref:TF_AP-2 domain-containing protein n=1 Tax=Haemonchus placei TaxID=6290 RepID=A0A0N4WKB9_HAEPC|nr:unnamed protein product [Haemonchus placei]
MKKQGCSWTNIAGSCGRSCPTELCLKDSFLWSANGWVSSEVLRNVWGAQEASLLIACSAAMRALRPTTGGFCRMHCGPYNGTAEHTASVYALKGAYAKLARCSGQVVGANAAHANQVQAAASEEGSQLIEQDGQEGLRDISRARNGPEPEASQEASQEAREESGNGDSDLKADLSARFRKYYRMAISTQDRQPMVSPRREIPDAFLQVGNEILVEELQRAGSKNPTSLNAAVYAIARAISAKAVEEASERLMPGKESFREATQLRSTQISFISTLAAELLRRSINGNGRGGRGRARPKCLEVARLYKVSRTSEVQRLLISLKDELNIFQMDIKEMEDARDASW